MPRAFEPYNSSNSLLPESNDVTSLGGVNSRFGNVYAKQMTVDVINYQTLNPAIPGTLFPIQAPVDGTVGAPCYSFNSETGLGLYRSSAGVLSWAQGGTRRGDLTAAGISLPAQTNQIVLGTGTLGTITMAALGGVRTWTLPDASGTFITTGNLSSITTVGTIGTGIWNGTAVAVANGGTGSTSAANARAALAAAGLADVNPFTALQEWAAGVNIASASSITLGTDGNSYTITGTTTITALSSLPAGTLVVLTFQSSLILTHNSTSLILQGGQSYTAGAGDSLLFRSLGSGNWEEIARTQVGVQQGNAAGAIHDPEAAVEFFEDFLGGATFNTSSATQPQQLECAYVWCSSIVNTPLIATTTAATGGVARVADSGTGTDTVDISVGGSPAGGGEVAAATPFVISKNPALRVSYAQVGTGNGTRRIGLADGTMSGGDPTNGIYFRSVNSGGTINAVCRKAGTESTLSTGIAAANGTFHKFRAVVTGGGTSVGIYADGALIGAITTNVPTVNLAPRIAISGQAASQGQDVDYFHIVQSR